MRLVVRPIFRPGENPRSLVARASLQRNISPSRFLYMVGIKSLTTLEGLGNLERCLRYPDGSISEWGFLSAGKGMQSFRGLRFHRISGSTTHRRVCTICMAEDRSNDVLERDPNLRPYIRSIWSLAHVTICPVHRIPLIDRCVCGAPIDISRAPYDRCRNGHRLTAPPAADVAETELRANEVVSAKLLGTAVVCHPQLEAMNWLEAGLLLCALGTFHGRGRSAKIGHHGSLSADDMRARMGHGIVVIDGLPESFERLLERFASPEVRAADPSTTTDGRSGVYGVKLMHWLGSSKLPGMETFRSIVDACAERHLASDNRKALVGMGVKMTRSKAEVPDRDFHTRIRRLPNETRAERAQRAKAVWQRKLTADEVERLTAQGLDVSEGMQRIDALRKCRQHDLVVTKFGAGRILGVGPHSVDAISNGGALDLAWSIEGTYELYFRSDVEGLKLGLFERATEPSPDVEYLRFGNLGKRARIGGAISAALRGMPIAKTEELGPVADLLVSRAVAAAALPFPLSVDRTKGCSAAEFAKCYALSMSLVYRLFKEGVVETLPSGLYRCVSTQAAEAFDKLYVSDARVSEESGIHTRTVNLQLRAFGVIPICVADASRLYHRADVARFFKFQASSTPATESFQPQTTSGAIAPKRATFIRKGKAADAMLSTSNMEDLRDA